MVLTVLNLNLKGWFFQKIFFKRLEIGQLFLGFVCCLAYSSYTQRSLFKLKKGICMLFIVGQFMIPHSIISKIIPLTFFLRILRICGKYFNVYGEYAESI